ncbi:hypothetical protein VTL71DRAFT_1675 [Oculimacula yallundae]|uniref:mRNA decay factor PAT1 domain-containing protein n=1 Tax=Oculimacula yallundae TaxID=86028 RepID=A0ABR4CCQ7_9HELO
MADSMCGPSNALQNFQKHSTVDRTLQQDRLVSRNSPAQGFRSSPGPNGALADREFESFQAGQLPLDHGYQPHNFSIAPQNLQHAGPSGWASDLQQLHISSPAPQFQQQPFGPQVQQRQNDAGWHEEFARQQQQQGQMSNMGQMPNQMSPQYRPMGGMNMTPQYMGGYAQPQANMSMAQQQANMSMAQQPQQAEASDEAFARAFEEAERAAFEEAERAASMVEQEQSVEMGQDILINESAERLMKDSPELLDQQRIGADTIHDPLDQSPEAREQHDDPNALAKTAGELLNSVQKEQSSKFQNSQFLELMRAFRDKEATVEGDQVVGTGIGAGMSQDAVKKRIIELAKTVETTQFEDSWHTYRKSQVRRTVFRQLFEIYRLELLIEEPRRDAPQMCSRIIMDLLSQMLLPSAGSLHMMTNFLLGRPPSVDPVFAAAMDEIDISSLSQPSLSDREPQEVAYDYIVSLLNDHRNKDQYLLKVLPYTLKTQPTEETLRVHLGLAEGFLGKDICGVVDRFDTSAIFLRANASVDEFFALLSLWERFGDGSQEVKEAVAKLESRVLETVKYE